MSATDFDPLEEQQRLLRLQMRSYGPDLRANIAKEAETLLLAAELLDMGKLSLTSGELTVSEFFYELSRQFSWGDDHQLAEAVIAHEQTLRDCPPVLPWQQEAQP